MTASDDGTVHLYDFSQLGQNTEVNGHAGSKYGLDNGRVRRSGRRQGDGKSSGQKQDQDEVVIFDVALTPDDFRPGTKNKKLDSVDCSSQGIVIAGTNTGEIHAWKLHFNEIANQNKQTAHTFLGTFKICKNARV